MRRILEWSGALAIVLFAFIQGAQYQANAIQKTCDSDEAMTVINGTSYVCLSPRHLEMMRQQRQQSWRGA